MQGLDLLIAEGELTAVVGASGSGKSTLMNILAGLDAPTAGSVRVAGHDLAAMTTADRVAYRRSTVGFVWQQTARNLLPYLTAQQNVMMPMRFSGTPRRKRGRRARELLDVLGIGYCADRRPEQLSGGEQQRAAIATALANGPRVLLADEPTGELDSATARDVFGALQAANASVGVTVLVVTHDPAVSGQVRRTIAIRDGRTATETLRHEAADEEGNATQHAVEYAVLDRAGRLQLPREMVEPLGMRDRVRLEAEPDHIGVWPDELPLPGGEPGTHRPGSASRAARGRRTLAGGGGRSRRERRPGRGGRSPDRARRTGLAAASSPRTGRADGRRQRRDAHVRRRQHGRPGAARRLVHAAARASWWRCAGGPARARPPCSTSSAAWTGRPAGACTWPGAEVSAMSEREQMMLRRGTVAFIFQSFGLIPMLSAAENVGIPLRINGVAARRARGARPAHARHRRPGRPCPAAPGRAVRRPAAAGGDRAGAGGQSGTADRRRADRAAGLGDRQADHAPAADRGARPRGSRPWSPRTTRR